MNNEQKNKWLMENVLKECWHEWEYIDTDYSSSEWSNLYGCKKCKQDYWIEFGEPSNPDFYTNEPVLQAINFFKLWRAIINIPPCTTPSLTSILYSQSPCSALADAIGEHFNWGEVK